MSFTGIVMGLCIFLIIGVLHPVVIKAEYYWSTSCWPVFAGAGGLCCIISLFVTNQNIAILLGSLGFSLFWSIGELFHQEIRVLKGWYPKNPKRKIPYGTKN